MEINMGLTITNVKSWPRVSTGGIKQRVVDILWDNAYPAGGESLTAANLGMNVILGVIPILVTSNGYVVDYDYTNSKLRAWENNTDGADAVMQDDSTAGSLDTIVTRLLVIGG